MLLQQVKIENQTPQDVRIEDGKFTEIADHLTPKDNEEVIVGHEKLMLPPFVDPHVHLDSALTAGQPEWNEKGILFDGINIWSKRKETLTYQDVKKRAILALKMQASHGVQFVRSHVDVTDPSLKALKALIDVRESVKDWMNLQLVAFPQEGILSYPNGKELMEKAVELGVDVVGAIPHYEFNREYAVESLHVAFDLAKKNNLLFDAHTDEIDDPSSRSLETLATLAYESGLGEKVTASHTTAMGSYNDAYMYKLMRLLKMSNMNFVSNPLVNMYLGGRFDNYPKRRGLTRVSELNAEGINVAFGEDDLKDPWYPMGNGNMLDALYVGLHATQMMEHEQIMNSYKFVTTNGAKVMHIEDYGIAVGKPASFVLLNAHNFYDALNKHSDVLLSVHDGKTIGSTKPSETELYI